MGEGWGGGGGEVVSSFGGDRNSCIDASEKSVIGDRRLWRLMKLSEVPCLTPNLVILLLKVPLLANDSEKDESFLNKGYCLFAFRSKSSHISRWSALKSYMKFVLAGRTQIKPFQRRGVAEGAGGTATESMFVVGHFCNFSHSIAA